MTTDAADLVGAYVPGGRFEVHGAAMGPLGGTTFAVKDLFDVRGRPTSAGNPTWAREHGVAERDAPVVTSLLEAGSTLVGKTVLDEMAFGVAGINPHHGTPRNPAAPGRLTGGSSCGSAAAVAAGLCDLALGTDTGGSVRIPASYGGLFGIRPSHGRIPLDGVVKLAPSFDTVGWLTRDVETFVAVGDVLLPHERSPRPTRALIATDALAMLEAEPRRRFTAVAEAIGRIVGVADELTLAGPAGELDGLGSAYRAAQGREAWTTHRAWIEAHPGALGPMAAERFRVAAAVTDDEARAGRELFERYAAWLALTLDGDAIVCLPTTPTVAPPADGDAEAMAADRLRTLRLTAPASAAGAAQVSLPLLTADGLPFGLSLLGRPGSDRALLALAAEIVRTLTDDHDRSGAADA